MRTHPLTFMLVLSAWSSPAVAADLLATAAKSSEIKLFVDAVERAGLAPTLKGNEQYTVFAPSNAAFGRMSAEERGALMKDKQKLAAVLSYHVLHGKALVAEVKPGSAKTLQGSEVKLKSDNGKITVNEANVTLSDIDADNGVIHVIDSVLVPAGK